MAKFLFSVTYSKDGLAGVLREGGSGRAKAVETLVDSVGGSVEALYWAFGEHDVILIADLPDALAAGALSTRVAMSGAGSVATTPLLTADDIDAIAARSQSVDYRAPGT